MRNLALVLAASLLAACSSTGAGTPPPADGSAGGGPAAPAGGGAAAADPARAADTPILEEGRSAFYRRIDTLAATWQAATVSPGESARVDARAAGTAIAREVWKEMDTVLSDLAKSENPRWRISAAKGLGFVNDPRARPALEGVLLVNEPRLLAAALVSLGRIASPDTDDRVVQDLLRFPDPVVQGNAAQCLAHVFRARRSLERPRVAPDRADAMEADLSVLLFEKDDPVVRANACQALSELGTPSAEGALLNCLRDEDPLVRIKAAQGLGISGTRRAQYPLLEALAREREENVKVMLALALGSVLERQGMTPPHADLGTDARRWKAWLER